MRHSTLAPVLLHYVCVGVKTVSVGPFFVVNVRRRRCSHLQGRDKVHLHTLILLRPTTSRKSSNCGLEHGPCARLHNKTLTHNLVPIGSLCLYKSINSRRMGSHPTCWCPQDLMLSIAGGRNQPCGHILRVMHPCGMEHKCTEKDISGIETH